MRLSRWLVPGALLACLPSARIFASQGWGLEHTGIGFGLHLLDDQVPSAIGPDRSRPWAVEVSQGLYAGHGFRAGLYGEAGTEEEHESCAFICIDYDMIGRYFWNTRYAGAGFRFSSDGRGFLDHFGVGLGYAFFRYHWGIYKRGWDSPYPDGYFLSGMYASHQFVSGLDYEFPLRLMGIGFALRTGITKTLAARNTFTPLMLRAGESPKELGFPVRPIALSLSLKLGI